MPFSSQYNLIFVHIPKTGGSSIERALNIQEFKGITDLSLFYKTSTTHLPLSILKCEIPNIKEFSVFTVVRNPYDRLLSEFFWRFKISENDTNNIISKFNQFVRVVFTELAYVDRLVSFDRHLETQFSFIEGYESNINVFKLEEIFKLEDWLSTITQTNIKLKCFNKSQKPKNFIKETFLRNKQTVKIINDFYQKDFEMFNYDIFD
jgi:23S rRNA A1618 N6-methylase RlmF